MEGAILDTMVFLEDLDFLMVFRAFGLGLLVFWLVVIGWSAIDASERFASKWHRLFAVLLIILLPLFGLLIYLTIRPRETLEEAKWNGAERRYLKFETAGLYDCPSCRYEVFPNYIFCPNCGYELRFKCKSCDVYLEPEWNTCPYCGEEQSRVKLDTFSHLKPESEELGEMQAEEKISPVVKPSPAVLYAAKPRTRPKRKGLFHVLFKKGKKNNKEEQVNDSKATDTEKTGEIKEVENKNTEKEETALPKPKDKTLPLLRRGWKAGLARIDEVVKKIGNIPLSLVNQGRDSEKNE